MEREITLISTSIDSLNQIVSQIKREMRYPIVLFIGQLGVGKTTFIKELIRQMGCHDRGSSPSYSIINEYVSVEGPIYHIDLYRMNTVEETFALGIEEIIYSGRPCFVEWPEIIMEYLDHRYHLIKLEIIKNNQREISFN